MSPGAAWTVTPSVFAACLLTDSQLCPVRQDAAGRGDTEPKREDTQERPLMASPGKCNRGKPGASGPFWEPHPLRGMDPREGLCSATQPLQSWGLSQDKAGHTPSRLSWLLVTAGSLPLVGWAEGGPVSGRAWVWMPGRPSHPDRRLSPHVTHVTGDMAPGCVGCIWAPLPILWL